MDYKTAAKEIKAGKVAPVLLCYGTETFIMKEFLDFLQECLIDPEQKDFSTVRLNLADTSLEMLVDEAQTPPFMVERKLVFAEGASFLTGSRDKAKVEHRPEVLAEYLESPAEHTTLILTVETDKLDERKKIVKQLKQRAAVIPFPPLTAGQLQQWVGSRARKLGLRMGDEAVEALILQSGTDLHVLKGELEKLALYAGEGAEADSELVRMLAVRNTEQTVFMLIDEIANVRTGQALELLYELLKQKEEPIKILALAARQFRILLQVKAMAAQGMSSKQMAAALGLHPFVVKKATEQAHRFEANRLGAILKDLAELDTQMKTGMVDKTAGLELFILKL